ncbi:MAG: hypothetical protein MUF22_01000 [Chitinispirillaceae bacterium]|jgi:hypothetical protein|nr:hypothetical protein [Chitinispirillaceae bacterium]
MKLVKCLVAAGAAVALVAGCMVNTEKCLEKEGYKNCEDLKSAAAKAVGNDESYKFLSIAKKCGCK